MEKAKAIHKIILISARSLNNCYAKFFVSIVLALVFFSVFAPSAQAATLYFSPFSGSYSVGSNFSVSIFVASADQAMNAASGVVSFPQDKLEITSLSKSGSILNLWVLEPSFSNAQGTVNFEGVVLNPGFIGPVGKLITLHFKVKSAGQASFSVSSSLVLANDGHGSNILTGSGITNFSFESEKQNTPQTTIPAPAPVPIPAPVTSIDVLRAPKIRSLTHPNQNTWYSSSDANFNWDVSYDITGVRLLYDKIYNDTPTVVYVPPINAKDIMNLADGIWYFHAQLKNNIAWGAVSHFRFQIDTQKPSQFEISEIPRQDLTKPSAAFLFDARDATSGIDYYEIQIDNASSQIWQDDGTNRYTTPEISFGKHVLTAKAVDGAGNSLTNSIDFTVKPIEGFLTKEVNLFDVVSEPKVQLAPRATLFFVLGIGVILGIIILFVFNRLTRWWFSKNTKKKKG